jgi:hypothetical protein
VYASTLSTFIWVVLIVVEGVPYMYWICTPYPIYGCLPFCGWPFNSGGSIIGCTKVFIINLHEIQKQKFVG